MAWTETDVRKERDDEYSATENESLKALRSSDGGALAVQVPVQKRLEVNDVLSYANILRTRNKFVDALVLYESVIAKDNTNVEAYIGKGICLQMQNSSRQAFECFTEAVKLDSQNACALTHLGVLYKDEGHLGESAEVPPSSMMHTAWHTSCTND